MFIIGWLLTVDFGGLMDRSDLDAYVLSLCENGVKEEHNFHSTQKYKFYYSGYWLRSWNMFVRCQQIKKKTLDHLAVCQTVDAKNSTGLSDRYASIMC